MTSAINPGEVEYTPRRCRACGGLYVWPKGGRAPGGVGPCCQTTIDFTGPVGSVTAAAVGSPSERPATASGVTRGDAGEDTTAAPFEGVAQPVEPRDVTPDDAGSNPAPLLGYLGLDDVLCARRCMRLADGRLDGEPLCVQCADLEVERWAAGNPYLPELEPFDFLVPHIPNRNGEQDAVTV